MFRLIPLIYLLLILPTTAFSEQFIDEKLSKDHETLLGFSMWETRKDDIFEKFGETVALQRSDTHHDPIQFCYLLESKPPVKLLLNLGWYTSFEKLQGFTIEKYNNETDTSKCKRLNNKVNTVKTGSGIYVGMSRDSFLKAFSVKLKENKSGSYSESLTSYEMTGCLPLEGREEFRQEGMFWYYWIDADFEHNILRRYSFYVSGEFDPVVTHSCSEKLRISWPALFWSE